MSYRPDIDGLRAIAVLAVIFFHFGVPGFGGGYVGVDIFFVISGYLIGGIILNETAAGRFSFRDFYARRIKRLFPAFFTVALASFAGSAWLLMPVDFQAFGKSLAATAVYLPNLVFYRDVGYFDAGAATKPLLHTWSLAVEEQFYILLPPLLIWVARRNKPAAVPVLLLLAGGASALLAQYLLGTDPGAAFYLLPARAWELLLGVLVATRQAQSLRLPDRWLGLVSPVALLMLLVPIVAYDEATPFPGLAAAPACLATAWLLWARHATRPGWSTAWLSHAAPVFVGRISYSLYLWHWPVHVLLLYYFAGPAPQLANSLALAAVLALGWLSWRYVEQPARHTRRAHAVVFGAAAAGSLLIAALGLFAHASKGWPGRLDPDMREMAYAAGDFIQSQGRCMPASNARYPGVNFCEVGPSGVAPTFVVWGDSHVRALRDGVSRWADETGRAGLLVWAGGCPPLLGVNKQESATGPKSDRDCTVQNQALEALLPQWTSVRQVLMVGRWAYYAEGGGLGLDGHHHIALSAPQHSAQGAEAFRLGLLDTVAWLRASGRQVTLLEQVPEFAGFSGRRYFQTLRSGRMSPQEAAQEFASATVGEVEQRQARARKALAEAAAAHGAGLLDLRDAFCTDAGCSALHNGLPAYFDTNHLTVATSIRLRHRLQPALGGP